MILQPTAPSTSDGPDVPPAESVRRPRPTGPTPSVAAPRNHHSTETYDGAELGPTCNRPGAYAAYALPSMAFGERRAPPVPAHTQALIEARRRQHAERARAPYAAKEGSIPARVIAYLRIHGGTLTFAEIAERFGLAATSVAATLKPAVTGGALVRHTIRSRSALSLPGHVLAAEDLVPPHQTD
jgi:hypothetical protein